MDQHSATSQGGRHTAQRDPGRSGGAGPVGGEGDINGTLQHHAGRDAGGNVLPEEDGATPLLRPSSKSCAELGAARGRSLDFRLPTPTSPPSRAPSTCHHFPGATTCRR